ncbi:hypothetical protein OD800_17175 [Pseudomonas aeruginosa]|uniref:hypothetical protein n=1 Tax=Pseudomonas aeruginosa TaxID=287 RepID=UPI000464037E|nr:hypothetical protein [Pseudomonas aeruginosa]EIU1679921.1 hypothetical protein [Pseudomonas aeruginosa]EKV4567209.1 hypothetical protein [Pseudomonas aeruginosa]KSD40167.1 hypothetical protein AO902_01645 [Pseudomonas aeruginosa]MBH8873988.1 hypothetical protein [Pseudomonas aeruginosa]MBI8966346.1 hypothetical protein [Pseudomonas aeruginosa]
MPRRLSLVVFPALFSIAAGAAEELKDMAGSTIVAAGRLEAVECPGAGLYDCSGWPANLYRFEGQDVCLSIELGCDYSCDGILSEKGSTQSILVSGSYRDHIRKVEGAQVSCPR